MTPFLKPYLNHKEFLSTLSSKTKTQQFERHFAERFKVKYAISFPWGRSALYSVLKGLNINNSEIILPAYTCVVVAHAVILSGNIPVFVDIIENKFNMDLDQVSGIITKKTKAIIATNLFGYPLNLNKLNQFFSSKNVLVIQDCALALGTTFKGKLVSNEGSAAIYSFNVRKPITTIGGGMVTTNDEGIFERVKAFRDSHFTFPKLFKRIYKYFFFLSQYLAFSKSIFSIVDFIVENTNWIDSIVLDSNEEYVHFPKDFNNLLLNFQASIGITQLKKVDVIIKSKRLIAEYYYKNMRDIDGINLPPLNNGATYSHYCIRIKNRDQFIEYMRRNRIQVGTFFDYCIPYLKAYEKYNKGEFRNSLKCSEEVVNLPNYVGLTREDQDYVIHKIRNFFNKS